jgi:23S rRNA (guanosine2251-2'-O)-methyltransferase
MNTKVDNSIIIVIPDVRSAVNVGSMFRTADACGVSFIYLAGITPAPLDQFQRPNSDIAKSALGAEKTIPWKAVKTLRPLITKLKKDGYQIIAIEQSEPSVDYKKVRPAEKVAFIVGNEVEGVPKKILSLCDIVAEIPMKGEKESLNVSVALGVGLFRMLNI